NQGRRVARVSAARGATCECNVSSIGWADACGIRRSDSAKLSSASGRTVEDGARKIGANTADKGPSLPPAGAQAKGRWVHDALQRDRDHLPTEDRREVSRAVRSALICLPDRRAIRRLVELGLKARHRS